MQWPRTLSIKTKACTPSCKITKNVIGTLLQVQRKCSYWDCVHQWSSQPLVKKVQAVNLQMCVAVPFTGPSFLQISKMRQDLICKDRFLDYRYFITWMLSSTKIPREQLTTKVKGNSFSLLSNGIGTKTWNTSSERWWGCDTGCWHGCWLVRWLWWVRNGATMAIIVNHG